MTGFADVFVKELPQEIASKEWVGEALLNRWREVKLEILKSCYFLSLSHISCLDLGVKG